MTRMQKLKKLSQRSILLGVVVVCGLLGLLPDCLMLRFLKTPCLFCGMTRSFGALMRLDWQTSLYFHPLTIPFCLAAFVLFNRDVFSISERAARIWVGLMAVLFLLVWLLRIAGGPSEWAYLLPNAA